MIKGAHSASDCWRVGGAAGVGGDVIRLLSLCIASWLVAVVEGYMPAEGELIVLLVVEGPIPIDVNRLSVVGEYASFLHSQEEVKFVGEGSLRRLGPTDKRGSG